MPANNPVVRGVHVASTLGGAGGGVEASPSEAPARTQGRHAIPFVTLMVVGLLVLLLLRFAGFRFAVSGSAT